ncbi:MAG: 3-phosphoshikimate 1-carboxyvinyltransferase [Atopobiaceae bacterium]|nr:3-phosphoshikimate 1-carboxyvinyltransferase [Atopobiaceae bacterium]
MDARVRPSRLSGALPAVASKSMAHRALVLATFATGRCELVCDTTSQDIEATKACLATLWQVAHGLAAASEQEPAILDCAESGSTLRFLLPVTCALGIPARFVCHGRLADRPLHPLDEQLGLHGVTLSWEDRQLLARGRLRGGTFVVPGNVSSQFVTGLLLAAPLLDEPTEVLVKRPVESRPYLDLTLRALEQFGQRVLVDVVDGPHGDGATYERFFVDPAPLVAPSTYVVEGDWSNAAIWLAAGAMEREGLTVTGLDLASAQGDRAILAALASFGTRIARKGDAARATKDAMRATTLDVSATPDLVPPLAAVATTVPGLTRITGAGRLRIKESDRLAAITAAIQALGGHAHAGVDSLVIEGVERLTGGTVDAQNDHRIAMMAALMATHAADEVTIVGAECVAKSYPTFWDDYAMLGGDVTLA